MTSFDYHRLTNVADVRSPIEYNHGHIPGAYSIPMFSDQERGMVGTCYKKEGKSAAVQKGLDFFATRIEEYLSFAQPTYLYCARGGMRSTTMAKLFQLFTPHVTGLPGGYKVYRNWVLKQFTLPYSLRILAGFTGSGKTATLIEMGEKGEQIIDLESLACHRGSSFGQLGYPPQPSQEHFENRLAHALAHCDRRRPIWVEDESHLIGTCVIPNAFFNQMLTAPVTWLASTKEERLKRLVTEYSLYPKTDLIEATLRIKKRLGGASCQLAVAALENDDFKKAFEIILEYYDKAYTRSHYGLRSF